jgi:hypothetical protein
MAEELILTTPITPPAPAPTTKYRVSAFTMDLETVTGPPVIALPPPAPPAPPPTEPGLVSIKLKDDAGNYSTYEYTGKKAVQMIQQLNTANLTQKSMQRRIMEKLAADGFLPGTVQGTPDPVVP